MIEDKEHIATAPYVTKQILGGGENVVMHHKSLQELIGYMKFNGLLIGKPEAYSTVVSVERTDGSSLSPDELDRLDKNGINIQGYRSRIENAVAGTPFEYTMPKSLLDPNIGNARVAILRSGLWHKSNKP
jgi:hypothetical protein